MLLSQHDFYRLSLQVFYYLLVHTKTKTSPASAYIMPNRTIALPPLVDLPTYLIVGSLPKNRYFIVTFLITSLVYISYIYNAIAMC